MSKWEFNMINSFNSRLVDIYYYIFITITAVVLLLALGNILFPQVFSVYYAINSSNDYAVMTILITITLVCYFSRRDLLKLRKEYSFLVKIVSISTTLLNKKYSNKDNSKEDNYVISCWIVELKAADIKIIIKDYKNISDYLYSVYLKINERCYNESLLRKEIGDELINENVRRKNLEIYKYTLEVIRQVCI